MIESRPRSSGLRGVVALAALTTSVLAACAPDDAAMEESITAEPAKPEMRPESETSAIGKEVWRIPMPEADVTSHAVGHTGSAFLLTVLGDDGMDSLIGNVTTGAVEGSFALPAGSGWPVITGDEAAPTISAAVPDDGAAAATAVAAFTPEGTIVWRRDAADLGTAPGTQLRVDVADAGRIVVRTAEGTVTPYQDAELWVLDAATGATVWGTPGGATVRWAQAAHGLLMYTWRADGADDQPSDRVTVRTLSDGQELTTMTVINDYGGGTRLNTQCGGIASADRIVVCRWQGPDRFTLVADTQGTVLAEWPASEPPLIDVQSGIAALTVPGDDGGLLGVATDKAEEAWRYSPDEVESFDIALDAANEGVMLGGSGDRNLVISSRTGEWLIRQEFRFLRPGAAIGNHAVVFRDGDALGYTAPGVAVATLSDDKNSVLFVRP